MRQAYDGFRAMGVDPLFDADLVSAYDPVVSFLYCHCHSCKCIIPSLRQCGYVLHQSLLSKRADRLSPDLPGDRNICRKLSLPCQCSSWRFYHSYKLPGNRTTLFYKNFQILILKGEFDYVRDHKRGYNCAQSVAFAFLDKVDIDPETLFKVTEGLGLGMGGMEGTCGAISAAAVLAGLKISTADLEKPNSKGTSYKASKACIAAFKEKNSTIVCRELKGVDTGKVLRACPDCIRDAVAIIEENLFPEE